MTTGPGENDTDEKAPLLPCLKEPKWFGRDDSVCRPLSEHQSSRFMPWVAVGYDHPHTFEFIATKRLAELNTTAEELQSRALAGLRERPAKWQSVEIPAHDGPLQVLVCMDDFFAAERVLDPAFMQEAQRILVGSRGLFVGVPRRGVLMVTSADQDRQRITGFAGAVAGQFSRGESALISPMLFLIKDGEIIGSFDAVAEAMLPDGEPLGAPAGEDDEDAEEKDAGQPDDPGAPFVSVMVTRNDQGTEDVHLMAGGEDFERLAKSIEESFMSLLQQHMPREEFSGHIEIVILAMTPPALRKQMPKLLEHLRGICNDLSRGTKRRYGVVMTFQKEALADSVPAPRVTAGPARPADDSPSTWRRLVRRIRMR